MDVKGDRFAFFRALKSDRDAPKWGHVWGKADVTELLRMYHNYASIADMADTFGRDERGVVARLANLGVIRYKEGAYFTVVPRNPASFATPGSCDSGTPGTCGASAPLNFEVVTLIRGKDARNVSDDDIVEIVRELEEEIEKLDVVKAKPKQLVQKIADLRGDIDNLVAFSDSREKI